MPGFLFGHHAVGDNSLPWVRDRPQRGQIKGASIKPPNKFTELPDWIQLAIATTPKLCLVILSFPASASSRTHDHAILIPRTNESGTRDVAIDLVQETKDNLLTVATASAVLHTKRGIKSYPIHISKTRHTSTHTSCVAWYIGLEFRLIVCLHTDSFHSS